MRSTGAKGGSRKSLFTRGGIYWSLKTGPVPVVDQIWVDYEGMGEAGAIGLPVAPAVASVVDSGKSSRAHRCTSSRGRRRRSRSRRHFREVPLVGCDGCLGLSGEQRGECHVRLGRHRPHRASSSDARSTGVAHRCFEVHGDIRERYRNVGGPAGALGFPTSDECDVPAASAPPEYNTFQHGSIVWFGSAAETYVCVPFDLTLGRVDTVESKASCVGRTTSSCTPRSRTTGMSSIPGASRQAATRMATTSMTSRRSSISGQWGSSRTPESHHQVQIGRLGQRLARR